MLGKLKKLIDVCTPCKDVQSVNTKIKISLNCCIKKEAIREYTLKRPLTEHELYLIDCFIKNNIGEDSLDDHVSSTAYGVQYSDE